MAHEISQLVRVASAPYAAGVMVSTYLYVTDHSASDIKASGFFNADAKRLRKGDQIHATTAMNSTPVLASLVVTSASGATPVTTAEYPIGT